MHNSIKKGLNNLKKQKTIKRHQKGGYNEEPDQEGIKELKNFILVNSMEFKKQYKNFFYLLIQ